MATNIQNEVSANLKWGMERNFLLNKDLRRCFFAALHLFCRYSGKFVRFLCCVPDSYLSDRSNTMSEKHPQGNSLPLAVVTGASEGIGKEFVRQLAAKGYNLLVIARRGHLLAELKTELEDKHHIRVETLICDLTKPDELKKIEDRLEKEESLEVLINNAGFAFGNVFPEVDPDLEESMIRLHVLAVMRLSRAALVPMCKRKKGYLINVSSASAFFSSRGSVEYTATKAYILSFSKSLQYDVRQYGVRVQALCPGWTHTGIHNTQLMQSFKKNKIPNWLWLSPEYVVRTSLNSIRRTSHVICIPSLRYKMIVGLFGNSIGGAVLDFFSNIVGIPARSKHNSTDKK